MKRLLTNHTYFAYQYSSNADESIEDLEGSGEDSEKRNMLRARLPTQQELTDLYREVEGLRKDKKLKDDTIKFLQKEKEVLQRELQNYEALCEGVVTDISSHKDLEAENKQLQADILHLKDIIRRQNSLLKSSGAGNTSLDRHLISRMCKNLWDMLDEIKTPMSDQVKSELEHQRESLQQKASPKKGETTWHFLEIIDRALLEIKTCQKKSSGDLPDLKAAIIRYSSSGGSTLAHTNLLTTNSTSLANLSTTSSHKEMRRSRGSGGRPRLERTMSAPALNGMVPHPPTAPPPSALKSIYKNDRPVVATVNMLDTL